MFKILEPLPNRGFLVAFQVLQLALSPKIPSPWDRNQKAVHSLPKLIQLINNILLGDSQIKTVRITFSDKYK